MKKFEYKTFDKKVSDTELNKLGEEGWELVSHSAVCSYNIIIQYYIFKRVKTDSMIKS